jgi:hypothetical protein
VPAGVAVADLDMSTSDLGLRYADGRSRPCARHRVSAPSFDWGRCLLQDAHA